jgi:hypothetical protein
MFLNYINLELDRHWRLDAPRAMVTLADDACGGEETQRDIWGTHTRENLKEQAIDKTPYYDEAGCVSDIFLGEFLPFRENYFEKLIFCHNFPFFGKEITINCHNCLHTRVLQWVPIPTHTHG